MSRKVRRKTGRSVFSAARRLKEYYYTVIIPHTRRGKSPWSPRTGTGPFSTLSSGVFKSQNEARAWAVGHLGHGVKFSIKRFLKYGGKTDQKLKKLGFSGQH